MSFDVYLTLPPCPACGRSGDGGIDFNITHNINPVVDRCIAAAGILVNGAPPVAKMDKDGKPFSGYTDYSWGRLRGWTGAEALVIMTYAMEIAGLSVLADTLSLIVRGNGTWGKLEDALRCLGKLRDACAKYPTGIIDAHG